MERIGRLRAPSEACGVILPPPGDMHRPPGPRRQVIELPNRSHTPRDSYEMTGDDIILEIQRWAEDAEQSDLDAMVIWHTHPGGSLGPSRGDLESKNTNWPHIVLSLLPDGKFAHTLF